MGLETGTYVNDLVATNPLGATDPVADGDNHIRLIKSVLKGTFLNAIATITFPSTASVMARTDTAQTFTGLQTFTDGVKTTNYSITEVDGFLLIKNGTTIIVKISSVGVLQTLGDIAANQTI